MTHQSDTASRFTIQLWVQITAGQTSFLAIVANKAWNGGAAEVLEYHPGRWPSDHTAVLATLRLA